MNIGAHLEGGADLTKRLLQMPEAVRWPVQRAALLAGAEPIRAEADALAPKRSGELAIHIIVNALSQHEVERGVDFKGDEAVVEVGPDLPHFYGYFLEMGTVKMPAHPFMRPAVDAKASLALNITLAHLWDSIRAVANGGAVNVGTIGSRTL